MEGYQWGEGGGNGAKSTGNKKHNQQVQNSQGEVKRTIENGEVKELICTTHGHELRGECWREWGYQVEGDKREKKNETTGIAQSIKYTSKKATIFQ